MELRYCPVCAKKLVTQELADRPRKACPDPDCGWVFWDNPLPVVAGIVEHEGNVILIQNKGWPPDWWGLVTGFLERNETAEEGIRREVAEELGLEAKVQSFVGVYSFFQRNEFIVAYHLTAQGPITQGDELNGYKSIPIDKLRPWPGATGQAVADWLAKR